MARQLSLDGHKVYGTYRKDSERIPGVTYLKADVQDQDSLKNAVNRVMELEGRIDTVISNAGMGIGGPLEFTSTDDAQRQMDVNFMGMVRLISLIVPIMRRQHHGHIICISSIGGLMGLPYQGMYSASKFAIEGYCEALRLEVRQHGIKVTVINPGDFSTGFTAQRGHFGPHPGGGPGRLPGLHPAHRPGYRPVGVKPCSRKRYTSKRSPMTT